MSELNNMKFRAANETDRKEWNTVVEQSNSAEIYHLYEWGELLEKTYNIKVLRLVAEKDDTIVSILPYVYFNNTLFGRKIVSLPFADIGGCCTLDEFRNLSGALIKKLIKIAKQQKVNFLEFRSLEESAKDLHAFGFIKGFQAFTYRIYTKISHDEIWKNYGKKIRHNIRKMGKIGLNIKEAGHERDLYKYYEIYLKRMKDFGTPPAPFAFWSNMWSIFYPKGMMKLIFSVFDGREIAGFTALLFKRRLYFILNVSLKKFWKFYGLNELLFDWYIRYASENRYEFVDFGRTREGTGVQRFKEKGWGVQRIPLNTYYLFLRGKKKNPLEIALQPDTNIYSRAWKRFIPIFLTPTLGHLIRKKLGDV